MWKATLVLLLVLCIAGCGAQARDGYDPVTRTVPVVNTTGYDATMVKVTVRAFDSNGAYLGEAVGFAYNISAGDAVNVPIGQFYDDKGYVMQEKPAKYTHTVEWGSAIRV